MLKQELCHVEPTCLSMSLKSCRGWFFTARRSWYIFDWQPKLLIICEKVYIFYAFLCMERSLVDSRELLSSNLKVEADDGFVADL